MESTRYKGQHKDKRKRLSNAEKLEIIEYSKQAGKTQEDVAKRFRVSRPAVSLWIKTEDQIRAAVNDLGRSKRKTVSSKAPLQLVEDMLYKWHVQKEIDAPSLSVSGIMLKEKPCTLKTTYCSITTTV